MVRLFVYGTLIPGGPNDHILQNIGGTFNKAYVWGKLYKEGWGSALGYPGVRFTEQNEKIEGYVFSSNELSSNWKLLDEFEGEAYSRVEIKAVLVETHEEVDAYIYQLN